METTNGDGAIGKAIRSYFEEFGKLKACSREFWVVQLVNLLDGVAYFAMLTVSTLYLSETLGYSDTKAGWLWGACMAVYTGVGFVAGFIGDSIGIKRTLYLSVVLLVASRLVISATEIKAIVLPALFVISVGTAIMTPILISATKRYTTPDSQTAGFNMLYFLMNIGAFLGNFTLDYVRELPWGNRTVFMVGSAMSILCWLSILLFWRRGVDKVDAPASGADGNGGEQEEKPWEAPWTIALEVMRESAFWRFMLFLVILAGVRLVFEHQSQVYPKYYQRTIPKYLFRTGAGTQGELDSGEPSEGLRAAFSERNVELSDNTKIDIEQGGREWLLTDGDRAWSIHRIADLAILAAPASLDNCGDVPCWTVQDVPAQAEQDMARGDLPSRLRSSFTDQGFALTEDAAITSSKRVGEWLLNDRLRTFLVRKTASRLAVFEAEPAEAESSDPPGAADASFFLEIGPQGMLDDEIIASSLTEMFTARGCGLREDAYVTVQEKGSRWKLLSSGRDTARAYYLRSDAGQLSVYDSQAPIGRLGSLNPLIICIGVIISTPIVARFKLFNVMFVGITLSAASMLFLALDPRWFCAALGLTLNQGYTVIVICQIMLFSLGEVIWSPRLYEYTAAIAPEGREASYMGLSYLPVFFARLAEGPIAGKLLKTYCPPDVGARLDTVAYTQSPQFMNVILAGLAIATPLLILVFKGVIQKESRLERRDSQADAETSDADRAP